MEADPSATRGRLFVFTVSERIANAPSSAIHFVAGKPARTLQFTHEIPLRPRVRSGKVDRSRHVVPVNEELNSCSEIVPVNP